MIHSRYASRDRDGAALRPPADCQRCEYPARANWFASRPCVETLQSSPLAGGDHVALHAAAAQKRAPRGDAARIDAGPADLAREAAVLDLGAAVHDDLQARGLGL